jgi:phosphate transport system protein
MSVSTEGHTVRRYDGELNHLHYLVLEMGSLVLSQVRDAVEALNRRDVSLAQTVIDRENAVDLGEVNADSEIVKLIARRCPVGGDLRLVFAVAKSVTDLERIGDEAVKIATLGLHLFGSDTGGADPNRLLMRDIASMASLALRHLECGLQMIDSWDADKAMELIQAHQTLDEEFQAGLRRLLTFVMEDARNIGFAVNIVLIIKALERIGDHARNLAEYVVYQVRGQDIRHLAEHHHAA